MSVTGVYFIPSHPNSPTAYGTVIERLQAAYNPVLTGNWGLEHRLMRDTPSCLPPSAYSPLPALKPRYMQFLAVSYYPSHRFIYISDRPNPDPWDQATSGGLSNLSTPNATQSAVSSQTLSQTPPSTASQALQNQHGQHQPAQPPSGVMMTLDLPSYISWLAITTRSCEPLWCNRHMVTVSGQVYEVGDFRVRVGDVRQVQPLNRLRGTVVEIEYRVSGTSAALTDWSSLTEHVAADGVIYPNMDRPSVRGVATEEDWEVGEVLIREFWSRLAVEGAKEAIRVPDIGKEVHEAARKGRKRLTTEDVGERNDGIAGVDLARQYMEIFRFNR